MKTVTIIVNEYEAFQIVAAIRLFIQNAVHSVVLMKLRDNKSTRDMIEVYKNLLEKVSTIVNIDPLTLKTFKGNSLLIDENGELVTKKKKRK